MCIRDRRETMQITKYLHVESRKEFRDYNCCFLCKKKDTRENAGEAIHFSSFSRQKVIIFFLKIVNGLVDFE